MKKSNNAAAYNTSNNKSNPPKTTKPATNMTNMNATPNFETAVVDPSKLVVHQMVADMGFSRTADEDFNKTAAHFNFYKKPVVDRNGRVITNHQEVLAAIANGLTELEVFRCELEGIELRSFISFTHRYYRKDLRASYATICFYQEYFETPEGSALAAGINRSSTREKIAYLMQTSDATIKRLMQVGKLKYEKLGLIEQGETSFKEVLTQIKLETLAANGAMKRLEEQKKREEDVARQAQEALDRAIGDGQLVPGEDDGTEGEDEAGTSSSETIAPQAAPAEKEPKTATIIAMPVAAVQPKPKQMNLIKGMLEIEGLGTIELKVDGGRALILLNGEEVSDADYSTQAIEQSYLGTVINTFTFAAAGPSGMTINLSVEQPAAQLRRAA